MNEPVYLRALEPSDLDRCFSWHNDRSLYEALGGSFHFVSKQAVKSWIERKSAYTENEINLAICLAATDEHVGNIYLHEVDWVVRRARLEVFIGIQSQRSKGYGQSAVRQVLSYAFDDLGLRKVYLDVLTDNDQAIHIYEKLGFTAEGTLRGHVFKRGEWRDLILMGVNADSFKSAGQLDWRLRFVP
jgi:RimJ/RimL family protein N-acetyltransferase